MSIFLALMFFVGLLALILIASGISWAMDVFINWFTSGE